MAQKGIGEKINGQLAPSDVLYGVKYRGVHSKLFY